MDELIKRFKNKDISAFEEIYNMYSNQMKSVIFNIVKNDEDTEELVQDVFIKAWNNAESYAPEKGRLFTWILNISRNAAIDKTRSKDFKKRKQNSDATFFVDIFESYDNLDKRVDALGIKKYLNNIKDNCKRLIELIYFKGYTQQEASEEIAIPLGTVKTNLRRCISDLRAIILNK